MQVSLALSFPHLPHDVGITCFIPAPDKRPRTVANFIYCCTAELPPHEMLLALRIDPREVAYPTAEDARNAGIKPFTESPITRIDDATLEMGSSPTRTIFGGYTADEAMAGSSTSADATTAAMASAHSVRRATLATQMHDFPAGTILVNNLGSPNTNASRYLILLRAATAEEKKEFASFLPIGTLTHGLEELVRAAASTQVHPRTCAPNKRVSFSACSVEFDYRSMLQMHQQQQRLGGGAAATARAATDGPRQRLAGRVRGRDDDDEADGGDEEQGTGGEGGFFKFSATFPGGSSRQNSQNKRRRAETVVIGPDGEAKLRTTAIAPGEVGSSDKFDFYQSQEAAFMNDIELIKGSQSTKHQNRLRRAGKQQQKGSGKSQSSKTKPHAGSTSSRGASRPTGAKKVWKRY